MWRSEPNTFVRTRAAPLDRQYSTHLDTSSSNTTNAWFHVPGSSARAVGRPDGLVTSFTSARPHSNSYDVPREAMARDDSNTWPHTATATAAALPSSSSSSPCLHRGDDLANTRDTASSELSHVLRRYREENARLREQLHAKALHETHLLSKVEELSRRHALLQMDYQRATHAGDDATLFTDRDANSAAKVKEVRGDCSAASEERVRQLQATVSELEGRVAAYREALDRSRAYNSKSTTTTAQGDHHSGTPSPSLHALLAESLHTADYLVKVFNALQHCLLSRHGGAAAQGGEGRDSGGGCPRGRAQCTTKCLQAAVKGAAAPADLAQLATGPENNTAEGNTETALAVREELHYCETVAVRLAAALMAAGPQTLSAAPVEPAEARETVAEEPLHAEAEKQLCDIEEPAAAAAAAVKTFSSVPPPSRRTRPSRCRPDVEDCEVQ